MESEGSCLIEPRDMVVVGSIGAPHGLKGWVKVHSYTESSKSLFEYSAFYLKYSKKDSWEPIRFLEHRVHGKGFIALIEGYDDIDKAQSITNCELGVLRSELPDLEPGHYYWTDFIGMKVVNLTGASLGVVEGLFETGANDVIIVKGEDRERLLPYVLEDVVKQIDFKTRVMRVDWDPEF